MGYAKFYWNEFCNLLTPVPRAHVWPVSLSTHLFLLICETSCIQTTGAFTNRSLIFLDISSNPTNGRWINYILYYVFFFLFVLVCTFRVAGWSFSVKILLQGFNFSILPYFVMCNVLLSSQCCFCREIVVQFNADVADGMQWKFIPTQREVCFYL